MQKLFLNMHIITVRTLETVNLHDRVALREIVL